MDVSPPVRRRDSPSDISFSESSTCVDPALGLDAQALALPFPLLNPFLLRRGSSAGKALFRGMRMGGTNKGKELEPGPSFDAAVRCKFQPRRAKTVRTRQI
jgi:hypothetical protein